MLHSPKSHFIEVTLFFFFLVTNVSLVISPGFELENDLITLSHHEIPFIIIIKKPLPHTNKWGTGVPSPKMFKCPIFSTSVLERNSEFNTLGLGVWFNPVKSFPHKHKDLSSAFKIYIKKAKCIGP